MFDHAPDPVRDAAIRARIEKCRRIYAFARPLQAPLLFAGAMLAMILMNFSPAIGFIFILFGSVCLLLLSSLIILPFIQFTLRGLFFAIVIPQIAYVTFLSSDPAVQLLGCALIAFTITAATLYASRVSADMQRFHDELHGRNPNDSPRT